MQWQCWAGNSIADWIVKPYNPDTFINNHRQSIVALWILQTKYKYYRAEEKQQKTATQQ